MHAILKAIEFADKKHEGQTRRGTGEKYITHPIAVSYIVAVATHGDETSIVASILHDVIEDTDATIAEIEAGFGSHIASIVDELTNDTARIREIGKLSYHKEKLAKMSPTALLIKLADRLDNIRDTPTEKMVNSTIELMEHIHKVRDDLSYAHKSLIAEVYISARGASTKFA